MENMIKECGPVVSIESVKIARQVDVTGQLDTVIMTFERKIAWVRVVTAEVKFFHGGRELHREYSLYDAGGFMKCVYESIQDAEKLCSKFGITVESTLSVVVEATVKDLPVLLRPDSNKPQIFRKYHYDPIPNDWLYDSQPLIWAWNRYYIDSENNPMPEEDWPNIAAKDHGTTTIWSSQRYHHQNEYEVTAFKARWYVESVFPREQR